MSRFKFTRRQMLGAAATTAAAGLVLARDTQLLGDGARRAAPRDAPPVPGAEPLAASAATKPAAAWLDGMLTGDDLAHARDTLAQIRENLAPAQPRMLEHDVLWQWRRELAQELRTGARAIAITRWDKAFVLKGLAREEKLSVRQTRISHSLFRTEMG